MTSRERAIKTQRYRDQRHNDTVSRNMTIKAMAKKGAGLAEIMTKTGMGPDYIKRIAGSLLK